MFKTTRTRKLGHAGNWTHPALALLAIAFLALVGGIAEAAPESETSCRVSEYPLESDAETGETRLSTVPVGCGSALSCHRLYVSDAATGEVLASTTPSECPGTDPQAKAPSTEALAQTAPAQDSCRLLDRGDRPCPLETLLPASAL